MANKIKNIIKFENIPQTIVTEIMEKIKDEKGGIGSIDFNKIIPMPDHIYKGELDGEAYRKHGSNNSIDWATRFWGTKWNAFNFEEQDTGEGKINDIISSIDEKDPLVIEMQETLKDEMEDVSYSLAKEILENEISFGEVENIKASNKIIFCTVWSEPEPVLEKLTEMYPDALITHQWADEDFGYNVGTREYEDGELMYENIPDGGTKESYEMAAEIIGFDLKDIGYKFSNESNTYEYVEAEEINESEKENSKIKVVLIRPMEEAKIVEINSGLKSMQETVGGLIECIQPFEETDIICNEEGKINGLDLNRALKDEDGKIVDIIAGDFFICAARSDEENFTGLTEKEAQKYCDKFKSPEMFFRSISGINAIKVSERETPEMGR